MIVDSLFWCSFFFPALVALYISLICGFHTGEGPGTPGVLSARDYCRAGFASCVLDLGAEELGSLCSPVVGDILLLLADAALLVAAAFCVNAVRRGGRRAVAAVALLVGGEKEIDAGGVREVVVAVAPLADVVLDEEVVAHLDEELAAAEGELLQAGAAQLVRHEVLVHDEPAGDLLFCRAESDYFSLFR